MNDTKKFTCDLWALIQKVVKYENVEPLDYTDAKRYLELESVSDNYQFVLVKNRIPQFLCSICFSVQYWIMADGFEITDYSNSWPEMKFKKGNKVFVMRVYSVASLGKPSSSNDFIVSLREDEA